MVALSILGDSYLYAVLPIYYANAGISLLAVGWLLSVNRWIRFLSNPAAGVVGRRVGWGWAFAGAMWVAALTTAAYGVLRGTWALSAARGLWGVSWSFLRLGGMAAVLADTPPGRRGKAMGLFTGIFRLGSFGAVIVGGVLADRLGFAGAALFFAGVTGVGALIASLPSAVAGRWGAPARTAESAPQHGVAANWLPITPVEWRLCLGAFGLQLAVSGVVTGTVGLLVKERLGMHIDLGWWVVGPATISGMILGSRFITDLLVGPVIGQMSDRRGRARVLGGLATVSIGAMLGLGWTNSLATIALFAVLLFLAGTGIAAVLDSWAGDLAGQSPGRFLPTYNTWQDLGAAIGPVLAYSLTAHIGLARTYTAVAVAGALVVVALRRSALGAAVTT
jgi:MFS family permease